MTESDLEQLALTWFQDSGWDYLHGPDIAPDGDTPERTDYRQVILPKNLRTAHPPKLHPGELSISSARPLHDDS